MDLSKLKELLEKEQKELDDLEQQVNATLAYRRGRIQMLLDLIKDEEGVDNGNSIGA